MYNPNNPIDGVRHIAMIALSNLAKIDTMSNVDSGNDANPERRKAAQSDLIHAINLLGDIRRNDELTVLRKIAFAVRVTNLWNEHATWHEKENTNFYHF